jgi:hypothetical protein
VARTPRTAAARSRSLPGFGLPTARVGLAGSARRASSAKKTAAQAERRVGRFRNQVRVGRTGFGHELKTKIVREENEGKKCRLTGRSIDLSWVRFDLLARRWPVRRE